MANKKKGKVTTMRARSKPAPTPKAGAEPRAAKAAEIVETMEFFPGQKMKVQLRGWAPRNSPAKEFRLHLDLSMPLSAGALSMPHEIDAAFESVATLDNGISLCDVEATVDPQTIKIFSTPETIRAAAVWPAAVINKLVVQRPKMQSKKDQTEVELRFSTTVKVTDEQLVWAKNHTRAFFWATFEVTQGSLTVEAKESRAAKANGTTHPSAQTEFPIEATAPSGKDAAAGSDS